MLTSYFFITRSGQGYSITNTFISNGRGNAAIVRGPNGNLANNNVSYVAFASFNFAPGFDSTYEGGFAQSLTVRSILRFEYHYFCVLQLACKHPSSPVALGNYLSFPRLCVLRGMLDALRGRMRALCVLGSIMQ